MGFMLLPVNTNFIKVGFTMSEGFKLMMGSWDHLVSMVTVLVDDTVLISGRGRDLCLYHHIYSGCGACQALYKTSIGGPVTGA
jgi:hypothetical protein